MKYQLLHGADVVRYWQPENDREAHLICEIIDLLKQSEADDEEWQKLVDNRDFEIAMLKEQLESERETIENMKTEYDELNEEFRQYKFSTSD
jgi:chromosome segregation ATPase